MRYINRQGVTIEQQLGQFWASASSNVDDNIINGVEENLNTRTYQIAGHFTDIATLMARIIWLIHQIQALQPDFTFDLSQSQNTIIHWINNSLGLYDMDGFNEMFQQA